MAIAPAPVPPVEEWIEVKTARFTIYSNAGSQSARRIGERMETLREALRLLHSGTEVNARRPTDVFVFRDRTSYAPYDLAVRSCSRRPGIPARPLRAGRYITERYLDPYADAQDTRDARDLILTGGFKEVGSLLEAGRGDRALSRPGDRRVRAKVPRTAAAVTVPGQRVPKPPSAGSLFRVYPRQEHRRPNGGGACGP
jgi:hypothetical protein